jgi:beta-ribofuranosylaminobenzene 5'-phosphate synthase
VASAQENRTLGVCSTVCVEAYARLHFGVLDLRGSAGRWFGGLGAAASAPSLLVSASRADRLIVDGEDVVRTTSFAQQFLDHHRLRSGAYVHVHRSLPSHAGLGSGTQLALAIARALAEIHDIEPDTSALARAMGRAQRSAIGTWTFAHGGLVVEGGRRAMRDECGPLIARLPFPDTWRCVVVVPDGPPGISGADEAEAFARLPSPSEHDVEHVSHLVLMVLLPALADADLESFGRALSEIQEVTGRWFAPAQGGTFASGPSYTLVRRLAEWGAAGVGQSSWGPTVYGIVDGDGAAARLVERVTGVIGPGGRVFAGPFRSEGARVWWP